ncbi:MULTISPECIES: cytochrome ubiquinol oxidase subunit I [unclassified Aureispira]|uniref:cytochrome ubiquinol oxidase subunit I n=1 Tax=unclassified Aureispira TaxID=2649989 RepID=UPI000696E3D9|nr:MULTISPECIES: cytochrome ubiquinol oxidase subunit I [unclassified Aureispira]WMX14859.1 cytochrome ubiquinol oxidase subunit I [Aureispira sp. CCB-E]
MDVLTAARLQMAFSLGFHIIFACIGMTIPFFMAYAEWRWLKTGDVVYRDLTKAWSKGIAIFFAVGAVSGTMLSFELGLLWPEFMKHAGGIIGMPFSWEGTAFFIEAIALGVFLYGWERVPKWTHWVSGLIVGISGLASGILVVAANSWMNSPAGFEVIDGEYVNIDPLAAMFNDAWFSQALHMSLASFVATGFAVAGLHGFYLLKNKNNAFHKAAFRIALSFGAIAAILIPISGDIAAKDIAVRQPAKLAAMEAHYHTEQGAPLIIGGIPNSETQTVDYAIRIPYALSFLAHGDFNAEVVGLDQIPDDEEPPVLIVHLAFQIMIGIGSLLALIGLIFLVLNWRKKEWIYHTTFLKTLVFCIPLGFIALEAGWTVTEVGRQPWIIYQVMRTKDAVTPMPGIQYSFYITLFVYLFLSAVLFWLMKRQINAIHQHYPLTTTTDKEKTN